MPQDQPLPLPSASPDVSTDLSYSGFTGLVTAETVGPTKVKLTWTASTDPKVVAYNVYDATQVYSPKLLKTVRAPASFTTVTSLGNESYYSFRVRAADAKNVEDTNTKDVPAIPYGGIISGGSTTSTTAAITFNDGSNADLIKVYCKIGSDTNYTLMVTVRDVTQTSANLSGLTSGTNYTCRVALTIGDFEDNNTSTVSFVPMGAATQLIFTAQPASSTAGVALAPQPVLKIMDANNNIVTAGPDSTALVTLTLSSASPTTGTLRGTVAMNAVRGVADFTGKGLNFQEAGVKIITATKADTTALPYGTAQLTASSDPLTISPAALSASHCSIAISPAGTLVADGNSTFTATVSLGDQYGNPISGVKPVIASSDAGDTLTQPTLNTNALGVTVGTIQTTVAGTKTYSITSPAGLGAVTANATFVAGPATKVAFFQQPANSPAGPGAMSDIKVAIEDSKGNVVTTGSAATANVSVSIFSNPSGGVLSGTATLAAIGGVATFSGLGIDKTGTGYKLVANSPSLSVAYSNAFNVTAGVPSKLAITAPSTVVSGNCSTAITVQMQDFAGNPANATANTVVSLGGMGGAAYYPSATCTGSPLASTLTFASGSNTKTLYLKDNKAESLTLTATDPASVMIAASRSIAVTPVQLTMSGPTAALSGACSTAFTITTRGNDGNPGNVSLDTSLTLTGLTGTQAVFYGTNLCSGPPLNPSAILVPAGSSTQTLYLKDAKSENLSISVVDPASIMTTTSAGLPVSTLPSQIVFTGPTSVVAGQCSTPFTVTQKDAAGNSVSAAANTTLQLSGLAGTSGALFTSASCTGAPIGSSVVIASGNSSSTIYFKDTTAETVTLAVSDPNPTASLRMSASSSITIGISPSALAVAGQSTVATNVCTSAFTVNTRDSVGNNTNTIAPITVNLTGAGVGGAFYSDSGCTTAITQLTFATGTNTRQFYFMGLNPAVSTPLTFTATDAAGVLTAATASLNVTPAMAWIGSRGTASWFQSGGVPVQGRIDALQGPQNVHLDGTKAYLYAADRNRGAVLKYDYANQRYIGWIGSVNAGNGNTQVTGSNINSTLASQCITTPDGWPTPGWCTGGQSNQNGTTTSGALYQPISIADDGTYIYVADYAAHTVSKYNASTGAFIGWIGRIGGSIPTGPGTGLSNACASSTTNKATPGWCKGGSNTNAINLGDGSMQNPISIVYANGFLFVSQQNAILRYDATTGAFMGWIGTVSTTSPTGPASDQSNSCATTANNAQTPGWCVGGLTKNADPRLGSIDGNTRGLLADPTHNLLYVLNPAYSGTLGKYDLTSGAFLGTVFVGGMQNTNSFTSDGTYLYIADSNRLAKVDLSSGVLIGWVGKIANSPTNGAAGCAGRAINLNTPGWCLGGTPKYGVDEGSFDTAWGIDIDGSGQLLVAQGGNMPMIKKFDSGSGAYVGQLTMVSTSPANWTTDMSLAVRSSFDDPGMSQPEGMTVDGNNLYLAEGAATRIKKILRSTGQVLGWVGGNTSSPSGGETAGCAGSGAMTLMPGWCLGSLYQPNWLMNLLNNNIDGLMYTPLGVVSDGTWIYSADNSWHRIVRYKISDGSYGGWIGGLSANPTTSTCSGVSGQSSGTGWCKGGSSTNGNGPGYFWNPAGLYYNAGYLYVTDQGTHRVIRVNTATGAFAGWIGKVGGTAPTSGCTPSGGYSATGWCMNGTSTNSVAGADAGGGFYFQNRSGITGDGTYLYIANSANGRVDKFDLNGVYRGSIRTRYDIPISQWTTNPTTWGNESTIYGVWTDGTYLYHTNSNWVAKRNLSTGLLVGWKGMIAVNNSPSGGDPGCGGATGATPGWCIGGANANATTMGGFNSSMWVTGDSNFIYISDNDHHRVYRLPK